MKNSLRPVRVLAGGTLFAASAILFAGALCRAENRSAGRPNKGPF